MATVRCGIPCFSPRILTPTPCSHFNAVSAIQRSRIRQTKPAATFQIPISRGGAPGHPTTPTADGDRKDGVHARRPRTALVDQDHATPPPAENTKAKATTTALNRGVRSGIRLLTAGS